MDWLENLIRTCLERDVPQMGFRAPKPGKHYSRTCDDIGAARKYIVYGGDDEFPAGGGVTVISLPGLMEKLSSV